MELFLDKKISLKEKPLIVQPNFNILLEVKSPYFKKAREEIGDFLELVKSPSLFFTYKMTNISLWNGFALGLKEEKILQVLNAFSKFPIPPVIDQFVKDNARNYGRIKLLPQDENYIKAYSDDSKLLKDVSKNRDIAKYSIIFLDDNNFIFPKALQGLFKADLINLNLPVDDQVGFSDGEALSIRQKQGKGFSFRPYQTESVDSFLGKDNRDGAGVIVLPCGSGKTIVGIQAMIRLGMKTLIITPNIISLKQWKTEILRLTNVSPDDIGEYSGEQKKIKPITIATYQIIVYRRNKQEEFKHFAIFSKEDWGLVIYDEIHLLPAPIFRTIAAIQAKRRLGLTATLVREDQREREVFALVGPKKYDLPWKELEKFNFIATAFCFEIKIPMTWSTRQSYFEGKEKNKFRISSENPKKLKAIAHLLDLFEGKNILIIGQYIEQLKIISKEFDLPIVTGKTPNSDREIIYQDFKIGKVKILVVSKIANFAIDLPNASVAIQVSGTFGSRQEEAQRLGRIIRPKKDSKNTAYFFNLVTTDSQEEYFSQNRKRFLMEQGYTYKEFSMDSIGDLNLLLEKDIHTKP